MRSPFSVENMTLYILAGGKSSRFGEDKARYRWNGIPLIEHVRRGFQDLAEARAVVKEGEAFPTLGLGCVYDERGDGPLSGIHAALNDAATEWIFVVPCDTLNFSIEWLNTFSGCTQMAIAFHDGKWLPLFSAFHKDALPQIEQYLDVGRYAIWQALEELGAKKIPPPRGWDKLRRIDYKQDLAEK